jgi:hypothetical protein
MNRFTQIESGRNQKQQQSQESKVEDGIKGKAGQKQNLFPPPG